MSTDRRRHGSRRFTLDLAAGRELGYVCKLLGIAHRTEAGLSLRVHPSFVHANHPLATTRGSFNAISVYGTGGRPAAGVRPDGGTSDAVLRSAYGA